MMRFLFAGAIWKNQHGCTGSVDPTPSQKLQIRMKHRVVVKDRKSGTLRNLDQHFAEGGNQIRCGFHIPSSFKLAHALEREIA